MPCITQQTDHLFRFGAHRHFLLLSIPMIQTCKTSFLHSRDFINIFHRDLVSLFQDQQLLRLVHSFYMPRGCHICTAILFFIGDEEGHRNFRVNLLLFQYQPYFLIQLLFFIFIQLDPLFRDPFRLPQDRPETGECRKWSKLGCPIGIRGCLDLVGYGRSMISLYVSHALMPCDLRSGCFWLPLSLPLPGSFPLGSRFFRTFS